MKKFLPAFIFGLLFLIFTFEVKAQTCNVPNPSGSDDTSKIQSTINSCPSGGTIVLAAGKTYTSGSIYLKANTTLKFGSASTVLQAHPDAGKIDIIPETSHSGFVIGHRANNVAIEGPGVIKKTAKNGHSMVEFQRSSGISVKNITIDSRGVSYHGFHLVSQGSDNVTFDGVTVYGQQVGSGWPWGGNDGIDIQNSQHVVVKNCFVETHDDGIAIATPKTEILDDVLVQNCTLSSDSAAIKFGTGSLADMKNVTFRNINLRKSRNAGIRIVNLDGGTFQNINFENIIMESDVNAWFVCGKGGTGGGSCVGARNSGGPVGKIKDVAYKNITLKSGGSHASSSIHTMDRVTFRDINFNGNGSSVKFTKICGLSIFNLTNDQNVNISLDPTVTGIRYDGGTPVCGGIGLSPVPTKIPTNTPVVSPTTGIPSNTPVPTNLPSVTPVVIPGDVDGDSDVDIFDYNILIGEFGVTGISIADLNSDGEVDIFDYNILIGNFGPAPNPTSVPTNQPTNLPTGGLTNTPPPGSATLYVEIHAIPDHGTAPLTRVDLKGDVTGTATGLIIWKFDCTNDGSFEHVTDNNQTSYTVNDLCNYITSGSYTSKVVATRQGITVTDTIRSTVE